MRTAAGLKELVEGIFIDPDINITPVLLSFNAAPDILAREAAGFFYASCVLSAADHYQMLVDLEDHFAANLQGGASCFTMPVNYLVIRQH